MKMLVTVTYAENEWVRNLELGRCPPPPLFRPIDLSCVCLRLGLKRGDQNQRSWSFMLASRVSDPPRPQSFDQGRSILAG
jgi:hypothetical protein